MKELSIYVHIPFCVQKCIYCNFVSYADKNNLIEEYFLKLKKEIEENSSKYKDYIVKTIFIGGGTPSCVETKYIELIFKTIKQNYILKDNLEFSIESNPNSLTEEKIIRFLDMGINRFSIGLQTDIDEQLKLLNRPHTQKDFINAINGLKKQNVKNFNIDLLLGLPNQTLKTLNQTLKFVTKLNPTHISAYGLILEEDTPLFNKVNCGEIVLPNEDLQVKLYDFTVKYLKVKGYNRYEVSNFAKKGYDCIHNKVYWQNGDYVGFGLSAHSKISDKRFCNKSSLEDYLSCENIIEEEYLLTQNEKFTERIMLGLRTSQGINLKKLNEEFNINYSNSKQEEIKLLEKNKFIKIEKGYLKATNKGFELLNSIILKLSSGIFDEVD